MPVLGTPAAKNKKTKTKHIKIPRRDKEVMSIKAVRGHEADGELSPVEANTITFLRDASGAKGSCAQFIVARCFISSYITGHCASRNAVDS